MSLTTVDLMELIRATTNSALQPGAGAERKLQHELAEAFRAERYPAALSMVEHMGHTFEAEGGELAVMSLGKVMCFASMLADRMDISPILDLARVYTARQDVRPHNAPSVLAHVVLGGMQLEQMTHAIALCVALCIDNCEVIHDLTIQPRGVFLAVGKEMLAEMRLDAEGSRGE